MTPPSFSVVIPAYNGSRTIGATIRSVLAQTVEDFELIVVDDQSTDDTPEIADAFAAEDPRVRVHRQANTGVAGARNTGVEMAVAPYIAFVDNDDLWMPNYLRSAGAALDASPEAGFAYTDAYLLDDGLGRIRLRTSLEHYERVPSDGSPEQFMLRLVEGNFIMSSLMIRREALEEVGGFSVELNGVDDWDLLLRLLAHDWLPARAAECVLVQRDRVDSQSKDELMMLGRSEAVLLRVIESGRYPESVEAAAQKRLEDVKRRIKRENSNGPKMLAIRLRRRLMRTRDRLRPSRDWHAEAPREIAIAFPEIAEGYGRPSTERKP